MALIEKSAPGVLKKLKGKLFQNQVIAINYFPSNLSLFKVTFKAVYDLQLNFFSISIPVTFKFV